MSINNYKELFIFLYLEKAKDIYIRIEDKQYYISLNKKDWHPLKKQIGEYLISRWGVEVCKTY